MLGRGQSALGDFGVVFGCFGEQKDAAVLVDAGKFRRKALGFLDDLHFAVKLNGFVDVLDRAPLCDMACAAFAEDSVHEA